MDIIKEIHKYISTDISNMNHLIVNSLATEEELITLISNHLSSSGGKRIRPTLTILCAQMLCGSAHENTNNNIIKLASAVEFIHMATLLHDDVVDGSKMRRFLPTANTIWGNRASILVGDFLFSKAFKLMVDTQSIESLDALSTASTIIAEGEVSQLACLEKKKMINMQEYFDIITAKTAELFSAACSVAAYITDNFDKAEYLKKFGLNLGIMFQISDDKLDYYSDASKSGKDIGDDFFEGKITLPLIYLYEQGTKEESIKLESMLGSNARNKEDLMWVQAQMNKYNISGAIDKLLNKMRAETLDSLEKVSSDGKSLYFLKQLVEFATNRSY